MRSVKIRGRLVMVGAWMVLASVGVVGLPPALAAMAASSPTVTSPARSATTSEGSSSSDAASAGSVPGVLTCLRHREAKPINYVVSCRNANTAWTSTRWASWGGKTASGTGNLHQNDCKPKCAMGHFHSYPAKIVLSAAKATKYGKLYSSVTFTYTVGGKRTHKTLGLLGAVHTTAPTRHEITFFAGRSGVVCQIVYSKGEAASNEIICGRGKPGLAYLSTSGKFTKCPTCEGDAGEHTPTLPYGKASKIGPFRCLSNPDGVVCTVPDGDGFLMSSSSIARVRGY
jgi:hypothetical protein